MSLLFAIVGAAILIVAGDMLVRGAIALSLKAGLSVALVSLTVVAFGTSAPELVISVQAALEGSPDIALGNVVGSNVANVLLIMGVPALIAPIVVSNTEDIRNYLFMVGASILLLVCAWYGALTWMIGFGFLVLLAGFLIQAYRRSVASGEAVEDDEIDPDSVQMPTAKMIGLLVVGIIGLPIGAHLLIEGARNIALSFGVSEAAIGLTLVALGTSLPELAASFAAAMRGRTDVVLGNVIGSNLLNILAILGITSIVHEIPISDSFRNLDIPLMVVATLALLPFMVRKAAIGRKTGMVFVTAYIGFAAVVLTAG